MDKREAVLDTASDSTKTALIPAGLGVVLSTSDTSTRLVGLFMIACGVILNYIKYTKRR